MKDKFFNFLFLASLSLGILSGCKIVEIDIATQTKYTVTFNSNGGSMVPSQEVVRGGKIQEPSDPIKEGYTFVNWTYQGEEWNFIGYSVSEHMILDANWEINTEIKEGLYSRQGNKIYFGEYPQTEVKDTSLIDELNTLSGEKPTSSNTYNWTDYNYYIDGSITSYMYYQDIDVDSDGTYDYRGAYFTQYRPFFNSYNSSSSNTDQDDNGYDIGTTYWFSYDPIEWNILKEKNGTALIIANLILDSQEFDRGTNNYELSNIRKFLNNIFYNTAFNDLQRNIIETILVDNSSESNENSSNEYVCNDTMEKIFLLSSKEINKYYLSDEERMAQGSDYAKNQGLYVNSSTGTSAWWIRSIYINSYYEQNYIYCIDVSGNLGYRSGAYYNNVGVRPTCQIIL